MPYYGQRKEKGDFKLTDIITIGALSRIISVNKVEEALKKYGGNEKRNRQLPSRIMIYYIILMTIYSHVGYREILYIMVEGLRTLFGDLKGWKIPQKSAVTKARMRVGVSAIRGLYREIGCFIAGKKTKGAWYKKWRVTSFDATTMDIADSEENEKIFGRPGNGRNEEKSAYPQIRLIGHCEQGTHVIGSIAIGCLRTGEQRLVRKLIPSLKHGMLNLADRNFFSYALWKETSATGADLLWRVKKSLILTPIETFSDGSFTAYIHPYKKSRKNNCERILVRVIEYIIDDPGCESKEEKYRLITTILDTKIAPAHELACLYEQRQEIEFSFDEIKTHQRGANMVLRSKTPKGVVQEVYGYLLAHFAIRSIMHESALALDVDPDIISFSNTIRIIRRKFQRFQSFSPSAVETTL